MKTYMFSDPHFDDENLFRMTRRCLDFASVHDCDEAIINNWNKIVKDEDTVYLLGDIGDIANNMNYISECLEKLNGYIILILGNHDREAFHDDIEAAQMWFDQNNIGQVIQYPIIIDNFYILSHEPVYVNYQSPMANIFGHVHDNCMYRTVSARSYCVCPERTGYKPIDFEDIKLYIKHADDQMKEGAKK